MSLGLFVAGFGLGILTGVWLWATLLGYWASSEAARRRQALTVAEDRLRAVHATALHQMADIAASAVREQTERAQTYGPAEGAAVNLKRLGRP